MRRIDVAAEVEKCPGDRAGRREQSTRVICVTRELRELALEGAVNDDAMVTGSAPGKLVVTWMVGKSTCGTEPPQERIGGAADEEYTPT